MFTTSRSARGILDFVAAGLVIWAAAYHTPVGALVRGVAARLADRRTTARPLLAYYTGGVYDVEREAPASDVQLPDDLVIAAVPPGAALGRGVYVTLVRLGPSARAKADELARQFALPGVGTPDDAAALVARASLALETEEAAVLAVFSGYDVARYAVARAKGEGRVPSLEVLSRQLPPTSLSSVDAASSALTLGTAYALAWPVAPGTRVSSPFGSRLHPTLGREQLHTGVDLAIPVGTPVKGVADGEVRRASEDGVNGRVIVIDHGRGVRTAYCHNSELLVKIGQPVRRGEVVALSGNTGRSTGPHLHYQLELGQRPVDPFLFRGSRPIAAPPEPARPGATELTP